MKRYYLLFTWLLTQALFGQEALVTEFMAGIHRDFGYRDDEYMAVFNESLAPDSLTFEMEKLDKRLLLDKYPDCPFGLLPGLEAVQTVKWENFALPYVRIINESYQADRSRSPEFQAYKTHFAFSYPVFSPDRKYGWIYVETVRTNRMTSAVLLYVKEKGHWRRLHEFASHRGWFRVMNH
ncbi:MULTISPECIES: hypothetical protein [unclassified Flavobacterium]|uniref:hypothetical protein n=1 Tax=unclassified Flavobacterium TaxID=196869 RepID=UPI001F134C8E|nr:MULTISPECIES: hypothetical protein [unclassified Flavobacterium]UMY65090.1 hypothetical protein MKO97_11290 [Flavobacterium sp. HJ-32-4]